MLPLENGLPGIEVYNRLLGLHILEKGHAPGSLEVQRADHGMVHKEALLLLQQAAAVGEPAHQGQLLECAPIRLEGVQAQMHPHLSLQPFAQHLLRTVGQLHINCSPANCGSLSVGALQPEDIVPILKFCLLLRVTTSWNVALDEGLYLSQQLQSPPTLGLCMCRSLGSSKLHTLGLWSPPRCWRPPALQ